MVKHQKEKQYISQRELRAQQKNRIGNGSSGAGERRLPFECCALTLLPFSKPVCIIANDNDNDNDNGTPSNGRTAILFDNHALVEHLFTHNKTDPVSGKPMKVSDIITLNMDTGGAGDPSASTPTQQSVWQCPIMSKPFNNHSKVVAILQPPDGSGNRTANVYSYEAVHELNIKPKHYIDLLSSKKFNKKRDMIWLYDPSNSELDAKRNNMLAHFAKSKVATGNTNDAIKHSVAGQRIMDKLKPKPKPKKDEKKRTNEEKEEEDAKDNKNPAEEDENESSFMAKGKKLKLFHDDNGVSGSNGNNNKKKYTTPSLTSTSATEATADLIESRPKMDDELLEEQLDSLRDFGKKGFVRLHTTKGVMAVELHCDFVPKTCLNFMGLASNGAYDKSPFHRSIKNFMIQGGKPKKASKSDSSLWGAPFDDEFDNRLKHDRRGVLSMANSGPKTNQRQFFVTYLECPHLNRKHTVFGHVIQGIEVLDALEEMSTNKNDEPLEPMRIDHIEVVQNPTNDAVTAYRAKIQNARDEKKQLEARRKASALGQTLPTDTAKKESTILTIKDADKSSSSASVGKYLPKNVLNRNLLQDAPPPSQTKSTKIRFADDTKKESSSQSEPSAAVLPTRLPPPPKKKMTFGDFSGW
jgi:peptidyl-prolyl cis-trans isomerase-like protein 2